MAIIIADKKVERKRIKQRRVSNQIRIRERVPVMVVEQRTNRSDWASNMLLDMAIMNSISNIVQPRVTKTENTIIIKESRGLRRVTDNEIRDSVKEQTAIVIDSIYSKVLSAEGLKPASKYSFNITMTNPVTKEIINKKMSFYGEDIMKAKSLIVSNRIKANGIKKILKREAWKIVYSIIKESM